MASSILNLLAGMGLGFYLTYNVDDNTHKVFHEKIYIPVKKEMKADEKPDYWTRVFDATLAGSKESVAYLRQKYIKKDEKK